MRAMSLVLQVPADTVRVVVRNLVLLLAPAVSSVLINFCHISSEIS